MIGRRVSLREKKTQALARSPATEANNVDEDDDVEALGLAQHTSYLRVLRRWLRLTLCLVSLRTCIVLVLLFTFLYMYIIQSYVLLFASLTDSTAE